MKMLNVLTLLLIFIHTVNGFSLENTKILPLENPVHQRGTISFILKTDKTYSNGLWEYEFRQTLVELPGLARCVLLRQYDAVIIAFEWENVNTGFYLFLKELPGPETYHLLFTWDAERGFANGYFNGMLFRKENSKYYSPWEPVGKATQVEIPLGPNRVTDIHVLSQYTQEDEAVTRIPKSLSGKKSNLMSQENFPAPMNVSKRKGKLIYTSKMSTQADIADWILEGPAEITFKENSMIMQSKVPNPPAGTNGHFNIWCPADFPKCFIAEWEYRPVSEYGISLVFFATRGLNGENIFDPTLAKRDGVFQPYVNGDIHNYWIVFYSNHLRMRVTNYATTYLNKSSPSSILSIGKTGIVPGSTVFHHVRLIKDDGHIQFQVNDKVVLDFIDTGSDRWGPVLDGGKFSFRQMAFTIGAYKNFNVWDLKNRK